MIEVKDLKKVYRIKTKKFFGKEKLIKAVDGVDIQCKKGKIIGILGINGAGKTTILRMLSTLLLPTSGSIKIDNIDVSRYPKDVRRRVNLITGGERNLYWRLTPLENLRYFGALYGVSGRKLEKRIIKLLKFTGLHDNRKIPVERFSKGMKQRLQVCRGLINDPSYLFLDEPTLGLDIGIAKDLRKYFTSLAKENSKSIVLTTHYIDEAEELCDYIYLLHEGKIIIKGSVREIRNLLPEQKRVIIKTTSLTKAIKETINQITMNDSIIKLTDNETICVHNPVENQIQSILKVLIDSDIGIINMSDHTPKLEDSLLNFTNRFRNNEKNN